MVLFFICSFLLEIFMSSNKKRVTQQVYENLYACYYLTNHTPSLYLILIYQLQHQVEDESKWIYILIFSTIFHLKWSKCKRRKSTFDNDSFVQIYCLISYFYYVFIYLQFMYRSKYGGHQLLFDNQSFEICLSQSHTTI